MKTQAQNSEQAKTNSNRLFSNNDSDFFTVQAKLNVGNPDDRYEQEADQIANRVVETQSDVSPFFAPVSNQPVPGNAITPLVQKREEEEEAQAKLTNKTQEEKEEEVPVQKKAEEEEEEALQMQADEKEEEVQTKTDRAKGSGTNRTKQLLSNSRGGGKPMHAGTQQEMESSFGADFSNVRIHTDSTAVQMNKDLGAHAFTSGNDIYFNSGRYRPESVNGKRLLAHELTHTVQQGASGAKSPDNVQMARDYNVYPWPWDDEEYCTVEVGEGQSWARNFVKGSPTGAGQFQFQAYASGTLASQSSFYGHFSTPAGSIGNYGWGAPTRFNLTSLITHMGGAGSWSAVRGCTFGADIEAQHDFTVHEPVQSISEPTVSPRLYDFLGAVPFQLEGVGKLKIKLSESHIRNTGYTAQRSFGSVNSVQQAQSFGLDLVPTASIGPISAGGGAAFGWSNETSNSLESAIEASQSIQNSNTVTSWQEEEIENTSQREKQSWMVLPEYVWKEWTVMAMPHNPATLRKTGNYTASRIGGLFATGGFRKVRSTDASGARGSQDPNLYRDPTSDAEPSTEDNGPDSELARQQRAENERIRGYQPVDTSLVTNSDHIQWMRLISHQPAARDYQSQYGRSIESGRGAVTIGGSMARQVSEGYAMARTSGEASGIGSSSNTNISASIAGIGDSLSFSNSRQAVDRTGQSISNSSGSSSTREWSWSVTVPQKINQRQFQVITPLCRIQTWKVLHGLRNHVDRPTENDYQQKYLVTVKAHVVPHSLLKNINRGGDLSVGLPDPYLV